VQKILEHSRLAVPPLQAGSDFIREVPMTKFWAAKYGEKNCLPSLSLKRGFSLSPLMMFGFLSIAPSIFLSG